MPYDTAGAKISQLPEATTPTDSDELAGVQNRVTKRFSLSGIKTWIKNWITKEDVGLSNVANVLQYSATNKPTGADVPYDGTTSGLSAATVQGAIDELVQGGGGSTTAANVSYDNTTSGLTADDVQEAIDELASKKQNELLWDTVPRAGSYNPVTSDGIYAATSGKQKAIDGGTIAMSTSWSGSGPYTQTVTVTGATVTVNSMVDLQPTPAQLAQLISDGVKALVIENTLGTLTATAIGAAPSTAMTIQCTVTEVSA